MTSLISYYMNVNASQDRRQALLGLVVGPTFILGAIAAAVGYFSCYAGVGKTFISEEPRRRTSVVHQGYTTDGTVTDKTYIPSLDLNLEGRTSFSGNNKGIGAGIGVGTGGIGAGLGVGAGKFEGSGHVSLTGSTSDEPRVGISCDKYSSCCPGYTMLTDQRSWATFRAGERVALTFVEMDNITYHDKDNDFRFSPGEKVLLSRRECRLTDVAKR